MKNEMSRVLTETIVKKTLKDLKDSPERSTRNLVNMALDFSEGRFQRSFFEMAQTMLENEQSPYYSIIKDCTANVDTERLLQFGMNIGYNSCTAGAKKIRKNEAKYGFNIPWTIGLQLDKKRLLDNPESYDTIIKQGEDLGIYTWMFSYQDELSDVLPLLQSHTDSAFILFCKPQDITLAFLDNLSDINHLMLAVRYSEDAAETFSLLRERQLLYSAYYEYGEENAEGIINGDLFYASQQVHPLITAVIPNESCSEEICKRVYTAIVDFRKKQTFQTITWDVYYDNRYIDHIISDDSCLARFDADGSIICGSGQSETALNLFDHDMAELLNQAFPKRTRK